MRTILVLLMACFVFSHGSTGFSATGDILFEEDFTTKSKVDGANTSAVIDTSNGRVILPEVTGSQSFDVYDDAMIVQNGSSIEFHVREADGTFAKQTSYLKEDAIAMGFSHQGYAHYILTSDGSVIKKEYGESSFITNPVIALTGLRSATTIAASEEKLAVGDIDKIINYEDVGHSLLETGVIELDGYATQLSMGDYQEMVVSTDQGVHVFRISEIGYVRSPGETLLGVNLGEMSEGDLSVVNSTNNRVITYREDGAIINLNHNNIVSIKAKSGSLYVRDENSITEYVFDGSSWLAAGKITGLEEVLKQYLSPRTYQSTPISLAYPLKRFGVDTDVVLPAPSTVTFEISSDGSVFYPVVSGVGELPEPTNNLIIRAVLNNHTNPTITPEITGIRILDKSLTIEKLETTQIVRDPGGNPPLPTELPVNVMGGYAFEVRVIAPGATTTWIQFSNGEQMVLNMVSPETFEGTHYFPLDAEVGERYDATVYAEDTDGNQVFEFFPLHFGIATTIEQEMVIYDLR